MRGVSALLGGDHTAYCWDFKRDVMEFGVLLTGSENAFEDSLAHILVQRNFSEKFTVGLASTCLG